LWPHFQYRQSSYVPGRVHIMNLTCHHTQCEALDHCEW
jgi:hypothetical protein